MYKKESHIRSLLKGITWRLIATADTILVVALVTYIAGNYNLDFAIKIGFLEFFIKLAIYYFHERIWQNFIKTNILYKTISWRLIATTMTFVISGAVLENFNHIALSIAIIELVTKMILYYIHEKAWMKLPLGKVRNLFRNRKTINEEK